MKLILAGLVVACVACGTSAATDAFAYTATISWSADAPEVVSVTVDGAPVTTGFELDRTFSTFDEARASTVPVSVVTTSGTLAFQLSPTACGDAPPCVDGNGQACGDPLIESESWLLFHGALGVTPGDPLEFGPDSGHCVYADGDELIWAA